jgi:hypothetical protein
MQLVAIVGIKTLVATIINSMSIIRAGILLFSFILICVFIYFVFQNERKLEFEFTESRRDSLSECLEKAGEPLNRLPRTEEGKKCLSKYSDIVPQFE